MFQASVIHRKIGTSFIERYPIHSTSVPTHGLDEKWTEWDELGSKITSAGVVQGQSRRKESWKDEFFCYNCEVHYSDCSTKFRRDLEDLEAKDPGP